MGFVTERLAVSARRRVLVGALVGLALTTLFLLGSIASRPYASDADVQRVGDVVSEALIEARDGTCPRPVLRGAASPGDATGELVALLQPSGPFAACQQLIESRTPEVLLALSRDPTDPQPPPDEGPTGGPMTPPMPPAQWRTIDVGPSHQPDPIEAEVVGACRGLDDAVQAIVAHESVCAPFSVAASDRRPDVYFWLTRALAILARERVRRGESRRGLELLLDTVLLTTDAQRGRPDLIRALVAGVATNICVAQIQGLLSTELAWQPGDLEELERQALLLPGPPLRPERWLMDDTAAGLREALASRGWQPPMGLPPLATPLPIAEGPDVYDEMLAVEAFTQRSFATVCSGATTREACATALAAERARAQIAATSTAATLGTAVPSLFRQGAYLAPYAGRVFELVPYVEQVFWREAVVRALPVLFVHRRLALSGSCPDAASLEAAIASLPLADGFGGRFSVLPTTYDYRPLEICAPSWLAPPGAAPPGAGGVRLPLLVAYCPALPVIDRRAPTSGTQSTASEGGDLGPDAGIAAGP